MDELTEYEKLIETTSQLAALLSAYYKALIENGFSPENALALSIQFQKEVLHGNHSK